MSETTAFEVGDRVRLKSNDSQDWVDLWLQRRERRRTPATITEVIGTKVPPPFRSYRIKFDESGGMRPFTTIIRGEHLEAIDV